MTIKKKAMVINGSLNVEYEATTNNVSTGKL